MCPASSLFFPSVCGKKSINRSDFTLSSVFFSVCAAVKRTVMAAMHTQHQRGSMFVEAVCLSTCTHLSVKMSYTHNITSIIYHNVCACVCPTAAWMTLDVHEAAANTQRLIKYLQLHLIWDFMWSVFLPVAWSCCCRPTQRKGKCHVRSSQVPSSQLHEKLFPLFSDEEFYRFLTRLILNFSLTCEKPFKTFLSQEDKCQCITSVYFIFKSFANMQPNHW